MLPGPKREEVDVIPREIEGSPGEAKASVYPWLPPSPSQIILDPPIIETSP
jgi:hypothetical protein